MVYQTPYPWYIKDPIHGISNPSPWYFEPPYPEYIEPLINGVLNPLPTVF